MLILVIEDEEEAFNAYEQYYEEKYKEKDQRKGFCFKLKWISDKKEAYRHLHYQLCGAIVDVRLKGMDDEWGTKFVEEFVKKCRSIPKYRHLPILIVSALTLEATKTIMGDDSLLRASDSKLADFYVEKKPGNSHMWQVFDNLRNKIIGDEILDFPPYRFDQSRWKVYRDDEALDDLTNSEKHVLRFLMHKADEKVYHRSIYVVAHSYGGTSLDEEEKSELYYDVGNKVGKLERDLNHHLISELRRKLDPSRKIKPIETVPGEGYKFKVPRR